MYLWKKLLTNICIIHFIEAYIGNISMCLVLVSKTEVEVFCFGHQNVHWQGVCVQRNTGCFCSVVYESKIWACQL